MTNFWDLSGQQKPSRWHQRVLQRTERRKETFGRGRQGVSEVPSLGKEGRRKKWDRGKNLKFNERHLSFFPLSHSPFTLAFTLAPLTECPRWTALPNLSSGTHCPYAWGELRRFPAFLKPRRRKISNAGKRWNRPRCSKLVP